MSTAEELSRLVTRYREEVSPALVILAGLTRMLDSGAHQVLQDDFNSTAKPWVVHEATEDLGPDIPDAPGLYMFIWHPGPRFTISATDRPTQDGIFRYPLYIGQAGGTHGKNNTLRNRYREYKQLFKGDPEDLWTKEEPEKREEKLRHYLQLGPLEYWYTVIEDRSKIENLEKRMIRLFSPPVNNIHKPRLRARLGRPRDAWE